MSAQSQCCDTHRRGFLRGSLLAAAALGGVTGLETRLFAASLTQAQRDALTPDRVVQLMLAGNERFIANKRQPRDWLAEQRSSAAGQYPAAVFLTCVDSRAPVEVVCDLGIGEAFNARVAGNAVNDDVLGSMEFATAAAGAKAVIVMGHTSCGAIKGAIDNVVLGNLTLLLARFKGAVDATEYSGDRSGKDSGFVDAVATTHVKQTVELIRQRSPVMAGLERDGKIKIVGSMYDIKTGRVELV